MNAHIWTYSGQVRHCDLCNTTEAYWDDEDFPIDPCPANLKG